MAAMSDYLENALLNHVLRNVSYTPPTTLYLALYTSSPSDSGGGTEVSGGGYVRRQITFSAPSNGTVTNDTDITFPTATADWGTVSYACIFDAETGGNMLFYSALSTPKSIVVDDQIYFPAGNISVTID